MFTLLTVVGRCNKAEKKTKKRRKTENEENGIEQTALRRRCVYSADIKSVVISACAVLATVSAVADSLYQTEMTVAYISLAISQVRRMLRR